MILRKEASIMKKEYKRAEMDVVEFRAEDIIVTSAEPAPSPTPYPELR